MRCKTGAQSHLRRSQMPKSIPNLRAENWSLAYTGKTVRPFCRLRSVAYQEEVASTFEEEMAPTSPWITSAVNAEDALLSRPSSAGCFAAHDHAAEASAQAASVTNLESPARHTRKSAKITAEDAVRIFSARAENTKRSGLSKVLAERHGITMKAVRDVWNLRTWSQVNKHSAGTCEGSNAVVSVVSSSGCQREAKTWAPTQYCLDDLPTPPAHAGSLTLEERGDSEKDLDEVKKKDKEQVREEVSAGNLEQGDVLAVPTYDPEDCGIENEQMFTPTQRTEDHVPLAPPAGTRYEDMRLTGHRHLAINAVMSDDFGSNHLADVSLERQDGTEHTKLDRYREQESAENGRLETGERRECVDRTGTWSEDALQCFEEATPDFDEILQLLVNQPFPTALIPIPDPLDPHAP